ncbi:hypothetical protein GJ496_002005 [Pomphorhynchus laevis]|nr:hypothetical protein GJ496_002005 [Pomphorhynchus laevis]
MFTPIALETIGAVGPDFLLELGSRLARFSGDARVPFLLMQMISTAIQLANAACIREYMDDPCLCAFR